jgi:hypothetical protein
MMAMAFYHNKLEDYIENYIRPEELESSRASIILLNKK